MRRFNDFINTSYRASAAPHTPFLKMEYLAWRKGMKINALSEQV
jgi:hypothetical protein